MYNIIQHIYNTGKKRDALINHIGCYRSYVQITTHCGIGEKWESRNSYNKSKAKGLVEMFQIDLHVQGPTSSSLILAIRELRECEGPHLLCPRSSLVAFLAGYCAGMQPDCLFWFSLHFLFNIWMPSGWTVIGAVTAFRVTKNHTECPREKLSDQLQTCFVILCARINKSNDWKTIGIFAENRWECFLKCSMANSNSVIICNV
jgi:hypothetical protein